MNVPVLTYHSMRIHGNARGENDLVALADDLEVIAALGRRVVPLAEVVQALLTDDDLGDAVAITCDDGPDFDFHDLVHPTYGPQRSVFNVLKDSAALFPRDRPPHATSFVIVSPDARTELDVTCMAGQGWWNDHWWAPAASSGRLHVGNHSWDHNHETLSSSFAREAVRGSFRVVDTREFADAQIRRAQERLRAIAPNPGDRLFAYPYGESSPYLVEEYFPRFHSEIGVEAAFGDLPEPVHSGSDRWNLPRFICGRDWRSAEDLVQMLSRA